MIDEITLRQQEHRLGALWLVFVLWGIAVVFQLAQVMVFDREQYLVPVPGSGWKIEIVPAGRGRILDAQGRPLAWSTRHFRVRWHIPRDPHEAETQWRRLTADIRPNPKWDEDTIRLFLDETVVLADDISSDEFRAVIDLNLPRTTLTIESYFRRHCVAIPGLRKRIGITVARSGTEIGASGFEQKYDNLLRGISGVVRVFVAESGVPISGTREVVRAIRPGYDVYMPFTLRTFGRD